LSTFGLTATVNSSSGSLSGLARPISPLQSKPYRLSPPGPPLTDWNCDLSPTITMAGLLCTWTIGGAYFGTWRPIGGLFRPC
jgi:hypothetical protein